MKFEDLRRRLMYRPFFETQDILILFDEPESQVQARLSRWVACGKLIKLRRSKYLLAPEYQKESPSLFYISNYLLSPSFVSLFTALQHYHCVPEEVKTIQSVTVRSTESWDTPLGRFRYYSIKQSRYFGFQQISLGKGEQQKAFLASLERAILDLCYFFPGEWTVSRWQEIRLHNLEKLQPEKLLNYAERMRSKKVYRAARCLLNLIGKKN